MYSIIISNTLALSFFFFFSILSQRLSTSSFIYTSLMSRPFYWKWPNTSNLSWTHSSPKSGQDTLDPLPSLNLTKLVNYIRFNFLFFFCNFFFTILSNLEIKIENDFFFLYSKLLIKMIRSLPTYINLAVEPMI